MATLDPAAAGAADRDGFLLLDKPPGISSFHALRTVKRVHRGRKVGFAGTLDPAATGLLLVGVGAGTRLLEYLEGMPKTYRFRMRLGVETDTYDLEGEVVARAPVPELGADRLEAALAGFRGDILQKPPAYSALKIQGKRACDRARAGEEVDLPPRPVRVRRLALCDQGPDWLDLELECSKGTYVRSLAHDLGRVLGCGGAAESIRRTRIGAFDVADACAPDAEAGLARLRPLAAAVDHLPMAKVLPGAAEAIARGMALPANRYQVPAEAAAGDGQDADWRVLDMEGRLLALAERDPFGRLCPKKVLVQA